LAINYLLEDIVNIDKTIFLKNFLKFFKKIPYNKQQEELETKKIKFNFDTIIDNIDNLELRNNQLKMSNIVNEALNDDKHVVIEAPT
jgi:hypothetical protein